MYNSCCADSSFIILKEMAHNIKIQPGQSLLDAALERCGSAECAFDIAMANGIGVSDEVASGQELLGVDAVNTGVVNYYSVNRISPASSTNIDELMNEFTGIEFMGIELDFKVS